jgi:hypothetical protein
MRSIVASVAVSASARRSGAISPQASCRSRARRLLLQAGISPAKEDRMAASPASIQIERTALPRERLERQRSGRPAGAFEGLRRARAALERAEQEVRMLEEVAQRLAGPFELARAHAVLRQLEVSGGSATGRGPGLFERLRAARARAQSAEAGLRAAEADLFSAVRGGRQ